MKAPKINAAYVAALGIGCASSVTRGTKPTDAEVAHFLPAVLRDPECRSAIAGSLLAMRRYRERRRAKVGASFYAWDKAQDAASRASIRATRTAHDTVSRFVVAALGGLPRDNRIPEWPSGEPA